MSNIKKIILDHSQLNLTINRLCFEIIENHISNIENSVLVGMQPRGINLAARIHQILEKNTRKKIKNGNLDTTFFRDDFRRREDILIPKKTSIDFTLESKNIILIDDVLYTGRSVRSALDALISFGRPKSVELLVLIDRRFSRELPIQPKYIGKSIDVIENEYVVVSWEDTEPTVTLLNEQI
ncbi:MAG: bifunctional pyr operon transcriptional regulator/uracil phosphoribosyltransferase [Flavobacteriales bacterium]|nr:bifunctional pyr operon transcriptional regulator/uracil phosphoribosyltransferase [Flavobacteriales bacterium]|tara:strand:+ start:1966 stop:2511 length:546 start_codon:yes stop_codon:yes gene_type:complete